MDAGKSTLGLDAEKRGETKKKKKERKRTKEREKYRGFLQRKKEVCSRIVYGFRVVGRFVRFVLMIYFIFVKNLYRNCALYRDSIDPRQ